MTKERPDRDRQEKPIHRPTDSSNGAKRIYDSIALRVLFWAAMFALYLGLYWVTEVEIQSVTLRRFIQLGVGVPLFLFFAHACSERLFNRPLSWEEIWAGLWMFFGKPFAVMIVVPALLVLALSLALLCVCTLAG